MQLHLVFLALLQPALCAQQPVDAAELQSALRSDPLNAWIESVATKRNMSQEAVRSRVQAVTYHLDPATKDSSSAGGKHRQLERRDQLGHLPYPPVYQNEGINNPIQQNQINDFNGRCRRASAQPPGSPVVPTENVFSFWRAAAGACGLNNEVLLFCKLPTEFGPRGWNQNARENVHRASFQCPAGTKCTSAMINNYLSDVPVMFGICTSDRRAGTKGTAPDGSVVYSGIYWWPMSEPWQQRNWDVYAQSLDNKDIDWTLYDGVHRALNTARTLVFQWSDTAMWLGTNPAEKPYFKFERKGAPTTIRLYTLLTPVPPPIR